MEMDVPWSWQFPLLAALFGRWPPLSVSLPSGSAYLVMLAGSSNYRPRSTHAGFATAPAALPAFAPCFHFVLPALLRIGTRFHSQLRFPPKFFHPSFPPAVRRSSAPIPFLHTSWPSNRRPATTPRTLFVASPPEFPPPCLSPLSELELPVLPR